MKSSFELLLNCVYKVMNDDECISNKSVNSSIFETSMRM